MTDKKRPSDDTSQPTTSSSKKVCLNCDSKQKNFKIINQLFNEASPIFKKLMVMIVATDEFVFHSIYKIVNHTKCTDEQKSKIRDIYKKVLSPQTKFKSIDVFADTTDKTFDSLPRDKYIGYLNQNFTTIQINPFPDIIMNMTFVFQIVNSIPDIKYTINGTEIRSIQTNMSENICTFLILDLKSDIFNKIITTLVMYLNVPDLEKINEPTIITPYHLISGPDLFATIHNIFCKLFESTNQKEDEFVDLINTLIIKCNLTIDIKSEYTLQKKYYELLLNLTNFNYTTLLTINDNPFKFRTDSNLDQFYETHIEKLSTTLSKLYPRINNIYNWIHRYLLIQKIPTEKYSIDMILTQLSYEYSKYVNYNIFFHQIYREIDPNKELFDHTNIFNILKGQYKVVVNLYNELFKQTQVIPRLLLPSTNFIDIPWNLTKIKSIRLYLEEHNHILSTSYCKLTDQKNESRKRKEDFGNIVLTLIRQNKLGIFQTIQTIQNQLPSSEDILFLYSPYIRISSQKCGSIMPETTVIEPNTSYKLITTSSILFNRFEITFTELIVDMIAHVLCDWTWKISNNYKFIWKYVNMELSVNYFECYKMTQFQMFWLKKGSAKTCNLPDNVIYNIESYLCKNYSQKLDLSDSTLNIFRGCCNTNWCNKYDQTINLLNDELIGKGRGIAFMEQCLHKLPNKTNPFIEISNKYQKSINKNSNHLHCNNTMDVVEYINSYIQTVEDIKTEILDFVTNASSPYQKNKKFKKQFTMLFSHAMCLISDRYCS